MWAKRYSRPDCLRTDPPDRKERECIALHHLSATIADRVVHNGPTLPKKPSVFASRAPTVPVPGSRDAFLFPLRARPWMGLGARGPPALLVARRIAPFDSSDAIGLFLGLAGGTRRAGVAPFAGARATGPRVERPSALSLFRARRGGGSGDCGCRGRAALFRRAFATRVGVRRIRDCDANDRVGARRGCGSRPRGLSRIHRLRAAGFHRISDDSKLLSAFLRREIRCDEMNGFAADFFVDQPGLSWRRNRSSRSGHTACAVADHRVNHHGRLLPSSDWRLARVSASGMSAAPNARPV